MTGWNAKQTAALAAVVVALLVGLVVERVRSQQAAPVAEFAIQRTSAPADGASARDGAAPPITAADPVDRPPTRIVVHVAGAVARPGIVELPDGARAIDAIRAAGGARPEADTDAVNLAARVQDGEQLVLPPKPETADDNPVRAYGAGDVGAAAPYRPERSTAGQRSGKLTRPGEGTVNINTATEAELQRLPGVGPAMASRILAFRSEFGRFAAAEQLMEIPGIGERTFERMKPFVRVR